MDNNALREKQRLLRMAEDFKYFSSKYPDVVSTKLVIEHSSTVLTLIDKTDAPI